MTLIHIINLPCYHAKRETGTQIFKKKTIYLLPFSGVYICLYVRVISNKVLVFFTGLDIGFFSSIFLTNC